MFKKLKEINSRPEPFQFYTARELWTNEHTSKQMLDYHLNQTVDAASRNENFIEHSVNWIISHFELGDHTEIADFGCGPGLYAGRLAERGAIVTGIDFSENSLDYAKQSATQKNLKIDYVLADYLEFDTEKRFDLVMMIMCDFCALSPAQRKKILAKFHSLLKPNGSVLLDVYSLKNFNEKEESAFYELNQLNGFWSPDDYYCFVNTFKYEKEKLILDKYTIIEKSRECVVYNWFQHFSPESLAKELEDNGFKVKGLYSDVAGKTFSSESSEFAVVGTIA